MKELEMDLRDLTVAPVATNAPWYFRLGRALERQRVRGATRLLDFVRRRGLLDRLVEYSVAEDVQLRVPIWRPCNSWDLDDVLGYESSFLDLFCDSVGALGPDAIVIDCGADIGTVSAHTRARCRNVVEVVAFEPNPAAFRILAANLEHLGIAAHAYLAAVSDFSGHGRLVSPENDASAHAMYLEPDPAGAVTVHRIDELELEPYGPLALKIDVEGSELQVVNGAARTIRHASRVAIAFEAHPWIAQRTGRDPICVAQRLCSLRGDLRFRIDTVPPRLIDPSRPVFEQIAPDDVYNIVATSGAVKRGARE